ncbi:PGAP1-like protein [Phaeobacter inhibens]|uniref:PGAP1-like protein n=1 Tax=Phaeobacter inhibens TaxID=221822 RepID=A0ABM6R9A3_9RHOB|nr:hypothetical protein [Phaeobacter inhibens]AUQ92874.1 PGAP1-like protein [Phaeobacter inhibens]
MSESLSEAERISRALLLELQAIQEDQVLEHFQKRISEIPEQYRPLVDSLVAATIVYGHKTNRNTLNSSPASDRSVGVSILPSISKRHLAIFLLIPIVITALLVGHFQHPTIASEPGKSDLRRVKSDSSKNLIVFVHGIRDDGNQTWTNETNSTSWLELIEDDIRFTDFDLATYHYSSMLFQNGNLSISNVADQLAFRLDGELVDGYNRIVFVAHSMGGIVVRNMLLKNERIARKVPLVYFLATPTAGSDVANLAKILGIKSRQLRALTSFGQSNFLQDQSSAWRASRLSSNIHSLCAFENLQTHGIMVVDQASAESLCTGRTIPSGQTHSGIAKPFSRNSIVYKVFADHIAALNSTIQDD